MARHLAALGLCCLAALSSTRTASAQALPRASATRSSSADPWWGRDKALHFSVSAALAGGGYALSSAFLDKPWQRSVAGGALALSAGIGKELWDASGQGDPSLKDLTWDALGTGAGLGVALAVDVLLLGGGSAKPRRANATLALRW